MTTVFTPAYCDANCGCDKIWFDAVSQNAHWLGAAFFVVALAALCGKWITWWAAAAVVIVYAIPKECWIDPATEPVGWGGGAASGGCDGEDLGFYIAGTAVAVIVVYFSQIKGSMWPWPPHCPCCSRAASDDTDEEEELLRQAHERVRQQAQREKELELTGLRHD
jgi:hypothetical protein